MSVIEKNLFLLFAALPAAFFIFLADRSWADPAALTTYNNNPVVAKVEGQPIKLDDLKSLHIHESLVQVFRMQKNALKRKVVEMLLPKHPELKKELVSKVTNEDVVQFYRKTPGVSELGSYQEMQGQIRDYLERAYEQSYVENIYKRALRNGWVVDYLDPPNDFRVAAGIGSAALLFDEDSNPGRKVLVMEYSDFQCPFCKQAQKTLARLRARYGRDVQFGYRHFPLPYHKNAQRLAEAAECAKDHGRFWELQALIFKNAPDSLNKKEVLAFAKKIGVKNLSSFEKCWDEGKYRERILGDIRSGEEIGIQATPTFVIGIRDSASKTVSGDMFSGAVSEGKFVAAIEKYLALSDQPQKASAAAPQQ
ncbi:MAG: DsbA family protein [Nitrospinales bacterium]